MSEPADLAEAVRDLGYEVAKALGVLRLIRRLGMEPEPWVVEREHREKVLGLRRQADAERRRAEEIR